VRTATADGAVDEHGVLLSSLLRYALELDAQAESALNTMKESNDRHRQLLEEQDTLAKKAAESAAEVAESYRRVEEAYDEAFNATVAALSEISRRRSTGSPWADAVVVALYALALLIRVLLALGELAAATLSGVIRVAYMLPYWVHDYGVISGLVRRRDRLEAFLHRIRHRMATALDRSGDPPTPRILGYVNARVYPSWSVPAL
jgi:hypothetical protein